MTSPAVATNADKDLPQTLRALDLVLRDARRAVESLLWNSAVDRAMEALVLMYSVRRSYAASVAIGSAEDVRWVTELIEELHRHINSMNIMVRGRVTYNTQATIGSAMSACSSLTDLFVLSDIEVHPMPTRLTP